MGKHSTLEKPTGHLYGSLIFKSFFDIDAAKEAFEPFEIVSGNNWLHIMHDVANTLGHSSAKTEKHEDIDGRLMCFNSDTQDSFDVEYDYSVGLVEHLYRKKILNEYYLTFVLNDGTTRVHNSQ